MKTKIQQFNQHYLVPLVLALGLVSLVFFLYSVSEWLNAPNLSGNNTFYYYEGKGNWADYKNSQQFSSMIYLFATLACTWSAMAKNKWVSILAIIICIAVFSI
ncbi:hypothetical protein [Echinicola shivajiensis]|uniref:hypothetical protein n=1 Tax=Echinicola shivajiensis TaxID=1035916 RepID=UPI001BFC5ED9|nr:hypothetical protein [Echinicola shivajiensis]